MKDTRWLVLFHRIPPSPNYSRVKTGRRLRRLGAVAIKNSVYVLPDDDAGREAIVELAREIETAGGEAAVCAARFIAGLSDDAIAGLFRAASDREYATLVAEAKRLGPALRQAPAPRPDRTRRLALQMRRLKRRFDEAVARDRHLAPGREAAARALALAEDLLEGVERRGRTIPHGSAPRSGGTWVTRAGLMADRIASAWLIRRFIDPVARFKFVRAHGHGARSDETRFDMAGAQFTHEGDRCTFEVLVERFGLRDRALRPIAEIVHDIDLEETRYRRPEAATIEKLVAGFAIEKTSDEARLSRGTAVFDHLYDSFREEGTAS